MVSVSAQLRADLGVLTFNGEALVPACRTRAVGVGGSRPDLGAAPQIRASTEAGFGRDDGPARASSRRPPAWLMTSAWAAQGPDIVGSRRRRISLDTTGSARPAPDSPGQGPGGSDGQPGGLPGPAGIRYLMPGAVRDVFPPGGPRSRDYFRWGVIPKRGDFDSSIRSWLILRFGGSIGEYHLELLCDRHLWRNFLRSRLLL